MTHVLTATRLALMQLSESVGRIWQVAARCLNAESGWELIEQFSFALDNLCMDFERRANKD